MNEQLQTIENEKKISRRELIRRALFSTATIATARTLTEGISLNTPPVEVRPRIISKDAEKISFTSELGTDTDRQGIITITSDGKLFYEPSENPGEEFFIDGEEGSYAHRSNTIESINIAYNNGANLFDIDANDVTDMNGTVYGEHGKIPRIKFKTAGIDVDFRLPLVLDQNEAEIKIGMPDSYEDLIRYIAKLKKEGGRPLAVSTELKRGEFKPDTIYNIMLGIHQRHGIPVMMYHADPQIFEATANLITTQQS